MTGTARDPSCVTSYNKRIRQLGPETQSTVKLYTKIPLATVGEYKASNIPANGRPGSDTVVKGVMVCDMGATYIYALTMSLEHRQCQPNVRLWNFPSLFNQ